MCIYAKPQTEDCKTEFHHSFYHMHFLKPYVLFHEELNKHQGHSFTGKFTFNSSVSVPSLNLSTTTIATTITIFSQNNLWIVTPVSGLIELHVDHEYYRN